jgi:hypothetical protein
MMPEDRRKGAMPQKLLTVGPIREAESGERGPIEIGPEIDLSELFEPRSAVAMPGTAAERGREDASLAEKLRDFDSGGGCDEQLRPQDCHIRYHLGIAYREVGLIDEAISEFMVATREEDRLLDCCVMLGLCFIEKGMPEPAMEWFEKGLKAVGWWEGSP